MLPSNISTPTDNLLFLNWPTCGVRYCTLPAFSQNRADLWQVFTRVMIYSHGRFGFFERVSSRELRLLHTNTEVRVEHPSSIGDLS